MRFWPAYLVAVAILAAAHLATGGVNGATVALVTMTTFIVVAAIGKESDAHPR